MDLLNGLQTLVQASCDGLAWTWNLGVTTVNSAGVGLHTALQYFHLVAPVVK